MNAFHGLAAFAGALLLGLAKNDKKICVYEWRSELDAESEAHFARKGVRLVPGKPFGDPVVFQFGEQACMSSKTLDRLRNALVRDFPRNEAFGRRVSDQDFIEQFLSGFVGQNLNDLAFGGADSQQYTPIVKLREIDGNDRLWAGIPIRG